MSIGRAIEMLPGLLRPDRLYVQLKNGAVWLHPDTLTEQEQVSVMSSIALNHGVVQLKGWQKVR